MVTLTKESQDKIKKAAAALATTEALILVDMANDITPIFVSSTIGATSAASKATITKATEKSISNSILKEYRNNMTTRGGSEITERVIEDIGGGKAKVYQRRVFSTWLKDLPETQRKEISKRISQGVSEYKNPRLIAKDISSFMSGVNHNAMTAARTESASLLYQSNIETRKELGQEYVRWVSAGDEKVRPEHQLLNGRIFRISEAPPQAAPNCRCVYVSADWDVSRGAGVESSGAVIMDLADV